MEGGSAIMDTVVEPRTMVYRRGGHHLRTNSGYLGQLTIMTKYL